MYDWNTLFKYDESSPTGLIWIGSTARNIVNGKTPAGGRRTDAKGIPSQCRVTIGKSKIYSIHRIIWEMFNGPIPTGMVIDHMNGNPWDNRIENLRVVTQRQNVQNAKKSKRNTSGATGVRWACKNPELGHATFAVAYYTKDDKDYTKAFSVNKLGLLPAFKEAFCWRQEMIRNLNLSGEDYTERHGQ